MVVQDEELAGGGHFEAMGATASISHSLLYNMQGFKGATAAAAVIIISNPWYEREAGEAGAPAHSFQHRRYAS